LAAEIKGDALISIYDPSPEPWSKQDPDRGRTRPRSRSRLRTPPSERRVGATAAGRDHPRRREALLLHASVVPAAEGSPSPPP